MAATVRPRVVVLGSGWGGFRVARRLDKALFDVTLVSPANHFLFTPLLPSTAVGTLEFRCIQEPVRTISGLRYLQAKAHAVDFDERSIRCRDVFKEAVFDVPYDKLVLAMGCKTNTFNIPGVAEREGSQVFYLKHLYHARLIRNRIIELFERASQPHVTNTERARLLSFVVVGGGPTSCEFTSELHDFVTRDVSRWYPDLAQEVRVTLIEAGPALLGPLDASLREYTHRLFTSRAVDVRTGVAVREVVDAPPAARGSSGRRGGSAGATGGAGASANFAPPPRAVLSDGDAIDFGLMVWSAGLSPVKLTESLPLARGPTGRLLIDGCCRVRERAELGDVFAIGDCAVHEERPLAQLAQVAEQQGRYVADVLNHGGHPEREFAFFSLGSMVSLGDNRAIYDGTHVGDPHGEYQLRLPRLRGLVAWLMWRGGYTARQVSLVNMLLIPMHWLKTALFGRDISRF